MILLVRVLLALGGFGLVLDAGVFRDRVWQLGLWLGVALAFGALVSISTYWEHHRARRREWRRW